MKKFAKTFWAFFGLVVLAGAAMIWWPSQEAPVPVPAPLGTTPMPQPVVPQSAAAASAPLGPTAIQHPIEAVATPLAPAPVTLPTLDAAEAYVRRTPSTRGPILGKAEYGDVLRHLEHRQGWIKVERDDGLKGWIARKLLWGW